MITEDVHWCQKEFPEELWIIKRSRQTNIILRLVGAGEVSE